MPASSRRSGTLSPPLSSAASYSLGAQSKLNIVSRLAIEGKAKQGFDGAAIKLYLKLSVPLESISPGMTVPLFHEENVKIRDFKIHPLDSTSAPYNFSSPSAPLIHNAAKALNLPSRSSKSYLSLFGAQTQSPATPSSSRVGSVNGTAVPPLEEKYTGYILVSGYNVCYVLPKEFPSQYKIVGSALESDDERDSSRSPMQILSKSRRNSVTERPIIQFVAALDLWVPYLSKPPNSPYLLSIPIPRCLSNTIKVALFPPVSTTASFASLSSEEESGGWELTTDPHVSRTSSKHPSRSKKYNHFADDESSDSSVTGFSEGCGIQGFFPSSDRIRIRWATPTKPNGVPDHGDGRRRVGVDDVKGDMTCTVLGKDEHGVRMRINYTGTCTGVWFPGAATMLGMDVGLDTQGCKIFWPSDGEHQWQVDGDTGFTGFDVGSPIKSLSPSRQPSMDFPQLIIQESSPRDPGQRPVGSRTSSLSTTGSTASLLRAPLPQQSVQEYSFENSTPTTSAAPSTVSSLTPSSSVVNGFGTTSEYEPNTRPPSVPITIHLNMNDLSPPAKNTVTFNISGIIVVTPPPYGGASTLSQSDFISDAIVVPLPAFRVLTADNEIISTTVRSRSENATVEVSGPPGSSTSRGTNLPNGSQMKCGSKSAKIAVRPVHVESPIEVEEPSVSVQSHITSPRSASLVSMPADRSTREMSPHRDGPLIIPWVITKVIPLHTELSDGSLSYAIKVSLPAPVDGPSEWLEFGLAMPPSGSQWDSSNPSQVDVVNASISDVPVRFEAFGQLRRESSELKLLSGSTDVTEKRKWLTWVRICCRESGPLEVLYTVTYPKGEYGHMSKGKGRAVEPDTNVFLPFFALPVARMEVIVEKLADFELTVRSNMPLAQHLPHEHKFYEFSLEPFSDLRLSVTRRSSAPPGNFRRAQNTLWKTSKAMGSAIPTIATIILLIYVVDLTQELKYTKRLWNETFVGEGFHSATTTAQVTTAPSDRWWHKEMPTVSDTLTTPISSGSDPEHARRTYIYDKETPTFTSAAPSETTHDETSILPYVPFTWPHELRLELGRATDKLRVRLEKVWIMLQMVFHWPLEPDD
ncbi:hypothetical protein BD410DRAFT_766513 [Rickenella mellea]|uniref:Uncharacterized protein n=1 Tax=Rickenella mellea TaxID=50990 RepID=A0A4Y7QCG5_9AGAM|nr:hypothetical protein BD410DRAFT_766513 [Rickenella mellea]